MVDAPAVAGEHGESPVGRLPPERLYRIAAPEICSAIAQVTERLVVTTRGALDDAVPAMVASTRHIPVLVVEPSARPDRREKN